MALGVDGHYQLTSADFGEKENDFGKSSLVGIDAFLSNTSATT
jgi:hypothetical protein